MTVSPTSLTVDEGSSGTYTVVLDSEPTSGVTVAVVDPTDFRLVDPTANTDVTAEPASLTFTTSNWDTAQTVTVSAAEDGDTVQDTSTVTHTVAHTAPLPSPNTPPYVTGEYVTGDYATITAPDVAVTVTDNDTPGVTVTPASLTVDEGGTDTYTVVLDTVPSGDVTVAISSDNTDVTLSSSSLTFTTTDWETAQTVTVTAGDDDDAADDTATLTHDPSGADYDSVSIAPA